MVGVLAIAPVRYPRAAVADITALVAEGVRRIVMGKINATARQLLREMGYQAEGSPTPDVLPREAAENLDLDPSSPEYRAALDHPVALGDIEPNPDPAVKEQGLYRLTRQGLIRVLENYTSDSSAWVPEALRRAQSAPRGGGGCSGTR
jgi:hypothetical protein